MMGLVVVALGISSFHALRAYCFAQGSPRLRPSHSSYHSAPASSPWTLLRPSSRQQQRQGPEEAGARLEPLRARPGASEIQPQASGASFVSTALLGTYIAGDVGLMLAAGAATQAHSRPAMLFTVAVLAFLIGLVISLTNDGWKGLRNAFAPRRIIGLVPVASLFSISTLAQLQALQYLSPVVVKVLYQLKLPLTMVLSTVMLKQRYSLLQIQALGVIFFAVNAFTSLHAASSGLLVSKAGASAAAGSVLLGLALVLFAVCLNVVGSLIAERAFRTNPDIPVYSTVANLKAGEALVSFALLTLLPNAPLSLQTFWQSPLQTFAGFDMTTWRLMALLLADSWMSALVVNRLSSVSKNVAKSVSIIALYTLSVAAGTEAFSLPQAFIALLVVQGSLLFSSVSEARAKNHVQS